MSLSDKDVNPLFIKLFRSTFAFTAGEFDFFLQYFSKKNFRKKEYYLKQGDVCLQKAYINRGCMRTYRIDDLGKELILYFPLEDWWVGDLESYYTQNPGKNNVQALEECELLIISKKDFDNLEEKLPKLKAWNTAKVQKSHFSTINRLAEVKRGTPEERYMNLLRYNPQVLQRVPQQYIAAYLDIEPQSLSRLRKRISAKG